MTHHITLRTFQSFWDKHDLSDIMLSFLSTHDASVISCVAKKLITHQDRLDAPQAVQTFRLRHLRNVTVLQENHPYLSPHLSQLSKVAQFLQQWKKPFLQQCEKPFFASCKNLRSLYLRKPDPWLLSYLTHAASEQDSFPSLNVLTLDSFPTSSATQFFLQTISNFLTTFNDLRVLSLERASLPTVTHTLICLERLPSLENLNLRYCHLHPMPSDLRPLTQLQHLSIYDSTENKDLISDQDLDYFAKFSGLHSFHLRAGESNPFTNATSRLAPLTSLQHLFLEDFFFDSNPISTLLAPLTALQSLILDHWFRLTDEGMKDLSALPCLKTLTLFGCPSLTHTAITYLSSCRSLTTLALGENSRWGDDTITALDQISSLQHFAYLGEFGMLTDKGYMRMIKKWPLSLSDAPFQKEFVHLNTHVSLAILRHQHIHESLAYRPSSSLGKFYQAVLQEADNVQALFDTLEASDRNLIFYYTWEHGGKPEEAGWAERHLFAPETNRHVIMKQAILGKLAQTQDKNPVYGRIWELAGQPRTPDPRYGENHARTNLCRLADALDDIAKQRRESKGS
jgi:hypothetical protein